MCGIAGEVSLSRVDPARVSRMAEAVRHRGPDGEGLWSSPDGRVCLAHRRLAIIDLSDRGRNPMAFDDGRLWITYNGEIYNYRELRRELEGGGASFTSESDTEVVLAAYDRWGVECLERFVGMFAFAIWDAAAGRLFIARDRLGKKPLYYAATRDGLVFASELKALVFAGAACGEIDPEAISLYLRYGYVPAPLSTLKGVRKLPPAHYALWDSGRLRTERYWDPLAFALDGPREMSDGEAESVVENLIATATAQRLVGDVPVGAFLSGGLDSSLVVAMMGEAGALPVRTFTVRFPAGEFNEADDAADVARRLRTRHVETSCTGEDLLAALDHLPELLDEPFADSSLVPTYLVSKAARREVKVVLSGDGGDELFAGYHRYAMIARASALLRAPARFRRAGARLLELLPQRRFRRAGMVLRQDDEDLYSRFVQLWSVAEIEKLTRRPAAGSPVYDSTRSRTASRPAAEQPPLLDIVTYLPEDILTKVDRASMAVGLEVRCPLLDHRLVETALSLPWAMKFRSRRGKWLTRRLLAKRLPSTAARRPKKGFGVPLDDWLRGPLRERMDALLGGTTLAALGIDSAVARDEWKRFDRTRALRGDRLWSLFTAGVWLEKWRNQCASSVSSRV